MVPTGVLGLASKLLELYGDEWLLRAAMHYRWHYKRNWPLVFSEFGQLVDTSINTTICWATEHAKATSASWRRCTPTYIGTPPRAT